MGHRAIMKNEDERLDLHPSSFIPHPSSFSERILEFSA
jgi:hypothetical protein